MQNQAPGSPGLAFHWQETHADQETTGSRGQCQGPSGRSVPEPGHPALP